MTEIEHEHGMTDEDVEEYREIFPRIARRVIGSDKFMEVDDLVGDLWLWAVRGGHKSLQRALDDPAYADSGRTREERRDAIIYTQARHRKNDELIDYRHFQGNYMYTTEEVVRGVKDYFAAKAGSDVEARLDISGAVETLEKRNLHKWDLLRTYYYGDRHELTDSEKRQARRIAANLTHYLNGQVGMERIGLDAL